MDPGKVRRHGDFEELLADPDIDRIDVCTPTHLHPETATRALRAGKRVLVEKVVALEMKGADAMLEAAGCVPYQRRLAP